MGIESLDIGQTANVLAGMAGNSSSGGNSRLSQIVSQTEGDKQRARDDRQMSMLVNQKRQEYSFNLTMLTDGIATNDFYGMGKAIDTFLSDTSPALKQTPLEQKSAVFLNAQPAIKNIRQTLQKLMNAPIVKIQPRDANGDFLTLEKGTLTTEIADRYKTPMTMPQLISAAQSDMYAARQILFNVGPSQKEQRAKDLRLIWNKGNDPQFGNRPRLLDHDETVDYNNRERVLTKLIEHDDIPREEALQRYTAHVASSSFRNDQIEKLADANHWTIETAAREFANQEIEDQKERSHQKHWAKARRMVDSKFTAVEQEDQALMQSFFLAHEGADGPLGHAFAAIEEEKRLMKGTGLGKQLLDKQAEIAAIDLMQSRHNAGEVTDFAFDPVDVPSEAQATINDFIDQINANEQGFGNIPDDQKSNFYKGNLRLKQIMTVSANVDPSGLQERFVSQKENKLLARTLEDEQPLMQIDLIREGSNAGRDRPIRKADQTLMQLLVGRDPHVIEKSANRQGAEFSEAYDEFIRLSNDGTIWHSQKGNLGTKDRWIAGLLQSADRIIDTFDGSKQAAMAAGIKKELYGLIGIEYAGLNRANSIKRQRAAQAKREELVLDIADLTRRGARTPLNARMSAAEKQALVNLDAQKIRTGQALMQSGERAAGVNLIGGVVEGFTDASANALTQVPSISAGGGGKTVFSTDQEWADAWRRGETTAQFVEIGGVRKKVGR